MDAKRAEVLAPAGDKTAFEAALAAGADAVYLGLQDFSARKSAANFTVDDLAEAARKAHALGAKVYVALNTLVKEGERENFFVSALQAWNAGADALIVQELFLGRELKRLYPEMELHLSTQAGVCNAEGARLAKEYGFSRIILARETPLSDIARIAAIVETECFVQGALCTCFSGQCYFSSVVGGNSGNRGLCKQPCRKRYSIDRAGFEKPAYRLSLADLCVGEDIEKLLQAGVSSFKIEGRMRSAAYVGAAVRYYRDILDGTGDRAQDLSDLKRTFNRGNYTKGYLFGQDKNLLSPAIQGHIGEAVGKVEGKDKSGRYLFVRSTFVPQDKDGFKVVRGGAEEVGGALWRSGYPAAKGGFYIPFDAKYRRGDDVCLTLDNALAARIEKRRRAAEVRLSITMRAGEPLRVAARGKFGAYNAQSPFIAEPSRSRPTTREELADCFLKVDGLPIDVRFDEIDTDGQSFAVRSQLNAFRRAVWADIYGRLSAAHPPLEERGIPPQPAFAAEPAQGRLAVIDRDFSAPCYRERMLDYAIFDHVDCKNEGYIRDFLHYAKYYARHKYLYLPAYCTGDDLKIYEPLLPLFDGVYADGYYALRLSREKNIPLFAGTGMNLFNRDDALGALKAGAGEIALSKELSLAEIAAIDIPSAFVFAGGRTRLMDLGHCPFGRRCSSCDRTVNRYMLRDEGGRAFPLLRAQRSVCRFTVYNCVPLRVEWGGNKLFDLSASPPEEKERILSGSAGGAFTAGASKKGIY